MASPAAKGFLPSTSISTCRILVVLQSRYYRRYLCSGYTGINFQVQVKIATAVNRSQLTRKLTQDSSGLPLTLRLTMPVFVSSSQTPSRTFTSSLNVDSDSVATGSTKYPSLRRLYHWHWQCSAHCQCACNQDGYWQLVPRAV